MPCHCYCNKLIGLALSVIISDVILRAYPFPSSSERLWASLRLIISGHVPVPYIITGNTLWSIYYRIYNINSVTESFTTCIPLSRFLNFIACLTSTLQIAEEFSNISKVRNLLSDFGKLRERSGDSSLPERQSTHFNTYFSTVMGMGKGYYIVFFNAIYSIIFFALFLIFLLSFSFVSCQK